MRNTILTIILLTVSVVAMGQKSVAVKGNVTDTKGEPLIGATIQVVGGNKGAVTDVNGNFQIDVPAKSDAIVVSYVGYKSQTLKPQAGKMLTVKLMEESTMMEQVVAIGYGSVKKGDVTSAISSVNVEDLEERAVSNVASVLQGELAGVEVRNTTGAPGGAVEISVRGATSVNDEMTATPLYVVDGIPMDDDFDLSMLNMSDIQKIEVLKDASSSAIYGSRGANGVIIVTSKKGKNNGKTDIRFNATFGLQTPEKRLDNLSPTEWMTWRSKYMDMNYVKSFGAKGATVNDDFYTRMQYTSLNNSYIPDPRWSMDGYGGLALIDWQDEMYRTATFQNYNISATSGNTWGNYRLSVGYTNHDGMAPGSNFEKLTVQLNGEVKIKDFATFGARVSPTISWNEGETVDGKSTSLALASWRTTPVAEPDAGTYNGVEPYMSYYWGSGVSPLAKMEETVKKKENLRIASSAYLNIDFSKHLQLQLLGSWSYSDNKNRSFTPSTISSNWSKYATGYLSSASWTGNSSHRFMGQTLLTYKNKIAKKHDVNVVLGWSAESSRDGYSYSMRATQFPNNNIYGFDMTDEQVTTSTATYTTNDRMMSVFGRMTYSYANRYLLNVSLRSDGNSRFGSNRRWATFPAFSAAWRISNESFWPEELFLTNVKLRISWGANGSRSLPVSSARGLMTSSNYVKADGSVVNGFVPMRLENPELTWQKTYSWNFGIDLGLWKNRISLSVDYYVKDIDDMLYNLTMPSVVGFTKAYTNTGNIRTKGLDIELKSNNLTGALKWTTSLRVGYMTNEVKDLGGNSTIFCGQQNSQVIALGHSVGEYYLYEAIGVYMNAEDLNNSPRESSSTVGSVKFRDVNGDRVIDENDRVYMGSPHPKFTYGLTNKFTWKDFDLSFLITAQTGGKIFFSGGRAALAPGAGNTYNVLSDYMNMWFSEDDPGDGVTPSLIKGTGSEQGASSRFLYSSDFIKLKNITLGYNVPLPRNKFVSKLRVNLSVENVFMLDKYKVGYSPEAANDSGSGTIGRADYGSYPLPRTFSLGVNVVL